MKVIVCKDYAEMSAKSAEIVADVMKKKPNAVLGLATGSTPEGMYAKLAEMNNYIPAEYDKIGAASVRTDGDIVWLVVSADQSAAEAAVLAHVR